MTHDPTIIHNRLRTLAAYAKAARKAQVAFFSLPKVVSPAVRDSFLNASKQAEKQLDAFMAQLDYEKLV